VLTRNTELRVALEQQTATSEVLSVISRSSGEVQPVFEIMLANATKLCEATYGAMWIREENGFRNAAFHGRPWRNPRIGSTYPSGDWGWRNPITDIAGCARPVIGHATAPPTSVMNSRRLMRPPSIYADATRVSDLTGALK
jgi:hypothetical protein